MFKATKYLFVLAMVIGVLAISALPANAWYTRVHNRPGQRPTHFLLAQLSSGAMIHFGFYSQEAVYLGSNEPDDHGLQDHTASARRSSDSFDAAARTCAQGQKKLAVRRLARSFHYLQDVGDPTDYLHGDRKTHVRLMAHQMLSSQPPVQSIRHWQGAYNYFQGKVAGMNLQTTLGYAERVGKQIGTGINGIYDDWYRRRQPQSEIPTRERMVQMRLLEAFGLLVACQDRMVVLFANRCRELASGQQFEAAPRPPASRPRTDYGSEAAPRPTVR